ncbi:hypothetical protein WEH80_29300 [Actinomycetes bacterium KLBMP 9759]
MSRTTMLRRALNLPVLLIAIALAALAVVIAVQTSPTETAADAAGRVRGMLDSTAHAVAVVPDSVAERASAGPCTWLDLDFTTPSGKQRPEVRSAGPLPAGAEAAATLERVAQHLVGSGWIVVRSDAEGLDAAGPGGYRMTAVVDAGTLTLAGEAPCVWPDGERRTAE